MSPIIKTGNKPESYGGHCEWKLIMIRCFTKGHVYCVQLDRWEIKQKRNMKINNEVWLYSLKDGFDGSSEVLCLDDAILANNTNKGIFQTSFFSEHAPVLHLTWKQRISFKRLKLFLFYDFTQVPPTHLLIRTIRCVGGLLFLFKSTSLRNFS